MGIQTTIENTRIATQSVKGSIGKKGSFVLFLSPGLLFLWGFSAAEAPPALRLLPPGWLGGCGSIGLTSRGHNQNGIAREIITMFSFNFQDDQIEKSERPQILREQMELEVAAFPPAVYIVKWFVFFCFCFFLLNCTLYSFSRLMLDWLLAGCFLGREIFNNDNYVSIEIYNLSYLS